MANLEWDVAALLQSPQGQLQINTPNGDRYLQQRSGCRLGPELRVTGDNVPQGDGGIRHRRFKTGMQLQLEMNFWVGTSIVASSPACGEDLRRMEEALMLHLNALLNAEQGRYFWQPTGYGDLRLLDQIAWRGAVEPSFDGPITGVSFLVDSPFPYAIDFTQQSTAISSGTSQTITNAGNAEFYPVIQVQGSTNFFEIINITTGLSVSYDATRPGTQAIGGGSYAELDFFRNTIYLNGDQDNLKPGIVVTDSDFFTLVPGANEIAMSGADATVLHNNAWA